MSKIKTPIYKIELYVVEVNNEWGLENIKLNITQALDDCVTHFRDCQKRYHEVEEDEWEDSFWNLKNTSIEEFRKFFEEDAASSASKEEY